MFLGLKGGFGCFAAVLAEGNTDPVFLQRKTWGAIGLMSSGDLAIYGGARSLVDWHARHKFCANAVRRPCWPRAAGSAIA